jgi:hypothetical protein
MERGMTPTVGRRLGLVASLVVLSCVLSAASAPAQQTVGGCSVLPADNIWNTPIDTLPVLSNSATMVSTIGASTGMHAAFRS